MRHIGVMGGAFNPIHTRHLMVAQRAVDLFGLEKVVFVPSGNPPHKKAGLLDKEARFEMVAAAVADNPAFEASRLEVDRPGESWTIDTLKQLQEAYGPDVRLSFIIGEDNIESLRVYDRRAEFLSLCRLLVSPRLSTDPALINVWRQTLPEADIERIDCPISGISSTLVRDRVRAGLSVRYMVPQAVLEIIEGKGHYQPEQTAHRTGTPDPLAPSPTASAETAPGRRSSSGASRRGSPFLDGFVQGGALGTAVGAAIALGWLSANPEHASIGFVALMVVALLTGCYIYLKSR